RSTRFSDPRPGPGAIGRPGRRRNHRPGSRGGLRVLGAQSAAYRRRPGSATLPVDRWAMMDQRERAENTEPMLAAEPIEKTEASEPAEAIERIEPLDPMLRMEPEDPSEREEPGGIRITAFWPAGAQPDGA